MVIRRGDVVWAEFGEPRGSQPAKSCPAVVIQEDWLLASAIQTALVVPLTSNTRLAKFPGNVLVPEEASSLDKPSVALVSQLMALDRAYLDPFPAGHLPGFLLSEIAAGIRLVTGI